MSPFDDIPARILLSDYNAHISGEKNIGAELANYILDNLSEIKREATSPVPKKDGFDKFKKCFLHKRIYSRGVGRKWLIKNPIKSQSAGIIKKESAKLNFEKRNFSRKKFESK